MTDEMNAAPATASTPQPLYWSIRRELWENRSVYVAPLIVSGIVLFGHFISLFTLARRMRALPTLDAAKQRMTVTMPYSMAASMIILTGFIVGVFYCVDALNGERRDRSILFWKSMPVSDRATVLSKACIPLAIQPLVAFGIALIVQSIMLMMNTMVLMASGLNPGILWSRLPLFQMTFIMFYGLTVHALWYAPLYSWLLLVSAWARRVALLWAVLPFVTVGILEKMIFGTSTVGAMLRYRFIGAMSEGFTANAGKAPITRVGQLDPLKFLSAPGLWVGLAFAAAFLAAAARLRRNREPI